MAACMIDEVLTPSRQLRATKPAGRGFGTTGTPSALMSLEGRVRTLFNRVLFVVFVAYFAVDAAFMTLARPVARRLGRLKLLAHMRRWISSLRPYPTLALFIVPLVILEPVKPVAA